MSKQAGITLGIHGIVSKPVILVAELRECHAGDMLNPPAPPLYHVMPDLRVAGLRCHANRRSNQTKILWK